MLVSNGLLCHRFEENIREGVPRLGRHLVLDARSLAYTIEDKIAQWDWAVPIKPAEHLPAIGVIDQGRLGSCTGNAGTYAVSALYGATGLASVHLDGQSLSPADAARDERFAVALYHEATLDDGFPGTYPPDDTGSSGLGVCRALKAAGLIDRYTWAVGLHGLATLLQRGGVMIGTPWYNAFFQPDAHGFIDSDPHWQNSGIAGGHEVFVEALEAWDAMDPSKSVVRFVNSWGVWGDHGRGRMRLSTYVALRQQIDCKQLGRAA